jgi:hypothetical protein
MTRVDVFSRVLWSAAAVAVAACLAPTVLASRDVHAASALTLYSVPSQAQYADNQDDRGRGEGHNPFGNYAGAATAAKTSEARYGPFAGDESITAYDLYSDVTLKKKAGTSVVVCQYGLDKAASCEVSFQLSQGTLTGVVSFGFLDPGFAFSLSGGTSGYRGTTGEVAVAQSQAARKNEALPLYALPATLLVDAQVLTFKLNTPAGTKQRRLGLYSYPVHQQFVNNNDDEARGDTENPFGVIEFAQCQGLGRAPKHTCVSAILAKERAVIEAHDNGPYAGDETVFLFNLYPNANRKQTIGAAELTCQYAFEKVGFCDVQYQAQDGTLVASGTFSFDAKSFTLPVTGGSGAYAGAKGDVTVTPGPHGTQHLAFTLTA